jgi:hypothetical protein
MWCVPFLQKDKRGSLYNFRCKSLPAQGLREVKMIQSVSVTPVWKEWKKFGVKQANVFNISIECGIKEADEIIDLLKEMTGRQYSTESEGEIKND